MSTTSTKSVVKKTTTVNLKNPSSVMSFAKELKRIIVENELYTNIKGKNYVNVEGWQIAGAFTNIFPIVDEVKNLSPTLEQQATDMKNKSLIKYRAEVRLVNLGSEQTIGRGIAVCSNKEKGKENFDEFAVASMAQTRAVGKAYRLTIGWLLKLAGYEATPAEEVSVDNNDTKNNADVLDEVMGAK